MSKSFKLDITDNMSEVIDGMPDSFSALFLTSLLDMACNMVLKGHITADIGDTFRFYLIAHIHDYVQTLEVNIETATK